MEIVVEMDNQHNGAMHHGTAGSLSPKPPYSRGSWGWFETQTFSLLQVDKCRLNKWASVSDMARVNCLKTSSTCLPGDSRVFGVLPIS